MVGGSGGEQYDLPCKGSVMAEYEGEYQSYILSNYYNGGVYLYKDRHISVEWDYRVNNVKEIKLKSGMSWEMSVSAGEVPEEVRVKVYVGVEGGIKVFIIEDGEIVDSASNSEVNEWEELILYPEGKNFLIRLVGTVLISGSYVIGYVKDLIVVAGELEYKMDDEMSRVELVYYLEEVIIRAENMIVSEGVGASVGIMLEDGGGSGGDEDIRVEDMAIRMGVGWDEVMIESGWEGGTIYLGPEGEEVALPEINWAEGSEGELEVEYGKKINMVDVINGGRRAWVREKSLRRWRFGWEDLSVEELELIKGYYESGEELRLKTNRDDEEWRRVVMSELQVSSKEERIARGEYRFRVTIELEEIAEED